MKFHFETNFYLKSNYFYSIVVYFVSVLSFLRKLFKELFPINVIRILHFKGCHQFLSKNWSAILIWQKISDRSPNVLKKTQRQKFRFAVLQASFHESPRPAPCRGFSIMKRPGDCSAGVNKLAASLVYSRARSRCKRNYVGRRLNSGLLPSFVRRLPRRFRLEREIINAQTPPSYIIYVLLSRERLNFFG